MKIHKLVDVLGAINDTGKLACDMYELGKKHYYSEARGYKMPISEMDFQHMVRAFVKLCEQEEMLDRSKHMGKVVDVIKAKDKMIRKLRKDLEGGFKQSVDDLDSLEAQEKIIAGLRSQVETLRELVDEKDKLLEKETKDKASWKNLYYNECTTIGHYYTFSEVPQDEEGKESCKPCTAGYYCAEGAAAALPCPGGTHKNASLDVMTSVDQCVTCPAGTFCPVGSEEPTPCAAGSVSNLTNAEACEACSAGTFQGGKGATACVLCTPGGYCLRGGHQSNLVR